MDGIDPAQFSVYAFNLAFAAQPLYYDIKLTEKFLPDLPRLKYVIITVGYTSLYYDGSDLAFVYKKFFDIGYGNRKFWKEQLLQSVFAYNSSQVRYMLTNSFTNLLGNNKLKKDETNPPVSYLEDVTSDEKGRIRAEIYKAVVNEYKGGDEIINELETFIVFLQSRNITPVLVSVPYYETIRKYLDESVMEKNEQVCKTLSEKNHIAFFDFTADPDFTAPDYHNCDHLNENGAKKFSRKINAKLMEFEQEEKR